jgi:predicted nucleic acid-binding protein
VTVLGSVEEDHERASQILEQCADRRLSYFDGLLMAVAERREVTELVTVDAAHFQGVRLRHAPAPAITVV